MQLYSAPDASAEASPPVSACPLCACCQCAWRFHRVQQLAGKANTTFHADRFCSWPAFAPRDSRLNTFLLRNLSVASTHHHTQSYWRQHEDSQQYHCRRTPCAAQSHFLQCECEFPIRLLPTRSTLELQSLSSCSRSTVIHKPHY